jgi:hypothetical protein
MSRLLHTYGQNASLSGKPQYLKRGNRLQQWMNIECHSCTKPFWIKEWQVAKIRRLNAEPLCRDCRENGKKEVQAAINALNKRKRKPIKGRR